MMHKLTTN